MLIVKLIDRTGGYTLLQDRSAIVEPHRGGPPPALPVVAGDGVPDFASVRSKNHKEAIVR